MLDGYHLLMPAYKTGMSDVYRLTVGKTGWAATAVLAMTVGFPAGGDAAERETDAVVCASARGWDLACLRQTYARPMANWPRPHLPADRGRGCTMARSRR